MSRGHVPGERHAARLILLLLVSCLEAGCATHDRAPITKDHAAMSPCPGDAAFGGEAVLGDLPLGCANRANLRAMVADPEDIQLGQLLTPASGAREARAVEAYKRGEVKTSGPADKSGSAASSQPPSAGQ